MKSGVVAFRIEARPLAISVWPQKIRLNGMRLFSPPMIRKAPQARYEVGMRKPRARTTRLSATAARPTRPSTTVNGRRSASATSAKKNEPPQRTESATSSSHSNGAITRS